MTASYARSAASPDATVPYFGHTFTFLAEAADTDGQVAVLDITAVRGEEPPPHTHSREDEGFLVVEGSATFWCDGEELPAPAGTFVWLPRGKEHGFAIHSDTARFLVVLTPAGNEAAFRRFGGTQQVDVAAMIAFDESLGVRYSQAENPS
jgi:quercetin dioxygenase-like cupin family protein